MDDYFIINNRQMESETDSETSTTSEAKELGDLNSDKTKMRLKLIEPIMGRDINLNNTIINDSFEITLLRLLHLFFNNDQRINFKNLEKVGNNELVDFFIDNSGIMKDSEFYSSEAGINLRQKWAEFLSNRNFTYIKNNYQIVPNIENFIKFFEIFFPIIFENIEANIKPNIQSILLEIYSKLNYDFESVKIDYATYNKNSLNLKHSSEIQNIWINGLEIYVIEFINLSEIKTTHINPISIISEFRFC